MTEIFVVHARYNLGDEDILISAQEHETYSGAMFEIAQAGTLYNYYTITKLFRMD